MTQSDFVPFGTFNLLSEGVVSYQSPSNIALVKYWGKHGEQLPQNTSLSFTLSNCFTKTRLSFKQKSDTSNKVRFKVLLDDKEEPSFVPKIKKFFNRIEKYLPFINNYDFRIETSNSFPHSSGIASSASGMSALAACLMEMEKILRPEISKEYLINKTSFLARLGSGSACRSLEGPLVVWGKHPDVEGSSDLFGVSYQGEVHKNFKNYQDTVLLVDKGEKQVSSTIGHNLMHDHAYAQARFRQANTNLSKLLSVLKSGDQDAFIKIIESEALTLHAMMMTSHPYFILMKPNTLEIINDLWNYRDQTGSKVCFTLDAGANVHVLYPENEIKDIHNFIDQKLSKYCQNGHYINDNVGSGAKKL
ncbi:diphosphomevalonate/mevalonate 3,5-bisphosphate decarboxylase family protein [Dokdonia sp. Hel_I_53]|uniref:diphosphomevalonate/mevalonate 3,5-bisphosphate decarboxylase family protein n=1 Tax=Dokdonia sp. Hel_I_53 TaxID=1566287 RepID=UPI00119B35C6|nr:diphosphomevalonate decarboxylase [Dokdonia sp. Hel_I_53]TVZ52914.1 diphosphomevalonate decarboxylase [Dokdonia sp. Hel_I_53]